MTQPISLEEARSRLSQMGKTAADLARELGVAEYVAAGVLAGRLRGTRGEAHKVAVALGIKDGVILGDDGLVTLKTPIVLALKAVAA